MFIVNTESNNKAYSKTFSTYHAAYCYAGQLPHYLSADVSIVIIDIAANKIAGAYNKLDGWKLGQPVLGSREHSRKRI